MYTRRSGAMPSGRATLRKAKDLPAGKGPAQTARALDSEGVGEADGQGDSARGEVLAGWKGPSPNGSVAYLGALGLEVRDELGIGDHLPLRALRPLPPGRG